MNRILYIKYTDGTVLGKMAKLFKAKRQQEIQNGTKNVRRVANPKAKVCLKKTVNNKQVLYEKSVFYIHTIVCSYKRREIESCTNVLVYVHFFRFQSKTCVIL